MASQTSRAELGCAPVPITSSSPKQTSKKAWVIPTVIIGTLTLSLVFVFLLTRQMRSSFQNPPRQPKSSQKDIWRRKRHLSQQLEEYELLRKQLIQKSIANRQKNQQSHEQRGQTELEELYDERLRML
jgi:hypothetical protein